MVWHVGKQGPGHLPRHHADDDGAASHPRRPVHHHQRRHAGRQHLPQEPDARLRGCGRDRVAHGLDLREGGGKGQACGWRRRDALPLGRRGFRHRRHGDKSLPGRHRHQLHYGCQRAGRGALHAEPRCQRQPLAADRPVRPQARCNEGTGAGMGRRHRHLGHHAGLRRRHHRLDQYKVRHAALQRTFGKLSPLLELHEQDAPPALHLPPDGTTHAHRLHIDDPALAGAHGAAGHTGHTRHQADIVPFESHRHARRLAKQQRGRGNRQERHRRTNGCRHHYHHRHFPRRRFDSHDAPHRDA